MSDERLVPAIKSELAKWRQLRAELDSPDLDAQTLLDTLEGETELHEGLLLIAEKIEQAGAHIEGLKAYAARLNERASRMTRTRETLRNIILSTMDTAGLSTVKGDTCTLSISKTARKLILDDEAKLPSQFFVPQDPKLDKKALLSALREGGEIPGATLSNGGISLTIRVK